MKKQTAKDRDPNTWVGIPSKKGVLAKINTTVSNRKI